MRGGEGKRERKRRRRERRDKERQREGLGRIRQLPDSAAHLARSSCAAGEKADRLGFESPRQLSPKAV